MKSLVLYVFHQAINVMRTALYFILLYLSLSSASLGLGPEPNTQDGEILKEKKIIDHFGSAQRVLDRSALGDTGGCS